MRELLKRLIVVGMVIDIVIITVLLVLKQRLKSKGGEFSDEIELSTILGGRELRSRSQAFRGGSVLTIAGGTQLDLRSAKLAPEGATLNVNTYMGGARILVPKPWKVEVRGRAFMGGIADRTKGIGDGEVIGTVGVAGAAGVTGASGAGEAGPRLVIEALAVQGGIEIGHLERSDEKSDAKGGRERINVDQHASSTAGNTASVPI